MSLNREYISRSSDNVPRIHSPKEYDEYFYGHGKLLLSGEYFVLDGSVGLALPVTVGQSLGVNYRHSYDPILHWKSYDCQGKLWFEEKYEFWHFDSVDPNKKMSEAGKILQSILREARKQNTHFLRDEKEVIVETKVGFPLEWGLGSSSTLVYNIAQWAYVGPFELLFSTFGGSGYDIACAQSNGPILYSNENNSPSWSLVNFDPLFKDSIYFLYQGNKQSSAEAINFYMDKKSTISGEKLVELSNISRAMVAAKSLEEFNSLIVAHEEVISESLHLTKIKTDKFPDYTFGEIKSLGAWGGDFSLVTSDRTYQETREYFVNKGYDVLLPYSELILSGDEVSDCDRLH